jgi:DNA primase
MYSWFDDAARAPLPEVIDALGLKQRRQSFGPCPGCGAELREKNRNRLPIGMTLDQQGWRCFPCGASGNVIGLVSLCLLGTVKAKNDQWNQIRQWFASYNWCQSIPGQAVKKNLKRALQIPIKHVKDYSQALEQFKNQVQDFWNKHLVSLNAPSRASQHAHEWLLKRGFSMQQITNIADQKLVKILEQGANCPIWARFGGKYWDELGYHLIFPAFNSRGQLASLRARQVTENKTPKSIAPDGSGRFPTAKNFVEANDLGHLLLKTGKKPKWWTSDLPIKIVIVEGEPDFLSWAARVSDADEYPVAVFGIWSGAWTHELAERIPDQSRIIIRTDHDNAGDRYAEKLRLTLADRCEVFRVKKRTSIHG